MALPKRVKLAESEKLLKIESELCTKLDKLKFTSPYIYKPLQYAFDLHKTFIEKYFEESTREILFLAINPGPWGMCQNGIPFGDTNQVKSWLDITVGTVGKPDTEHPKKIISGLNCIRQEQSGKKFWDLFKILCGCPENFFKNSFVYNLCPLAFLASTGKNITPKEIEDTTKDSLLYECEETLIEILKEFNFKKVIAVGCFPKEEVKKALKRHEITSVEVVFMPHPSSRGPKYRKDWKLKAYKILRENDLIKYFTDNNSIDENLLKDNAEYNKGNKNDPN